MALTLKELLALRGALNKAIRYETKTMGKDYITVKEYEELKHKIEKAIDKE